MRERQQREGNIYIESARKKGGGKSETYLNQKLVEKRPFDNIKVCRWRGVLKHFHNEIIVLLMSRKGVNQRLIEVQY